MPVRTGSGSPSVPSLALAGAMAAGMVLGRRGKFALAAGIFAVAGVKCLLNKPKLDRKRPSPPSPLPENGHIETVPLPDLSAPTSPAVWDPSALPVFSSGAEQGDTVWYGWQQAVPVPAMESAPVSGLKLPEALFVEAPVPAVNLPVSTTPASGVIDFAEIPCEVPSASIFATAPTQVSLEPVPFVSSIPINTSAAEIITPREPAVLPEPRQSGIAPRTLHQIAPVPVSHSNETRIHAGLSKSGDSRGLHRSAIPLAPVTDRRKGRSPMALLALAVALLIGALTLASLVEIPWLKDLQQHFQFARSHSSEATQPKAASAFPSVSSRIKSDADAPIR